MPLRHIAVQLFVVAAKTPVYDEILQKRMAQAVELGMSGEFMKEVMQAIHEESVHQQMDIINK